MTGIEIFSLFFIPGCVLAAGLIWLWVAYEVNKYR